jgi:endothelin-converting enzyme/putative endopeptidase
MTLRSAALAAGLLVAGVALGAQQPALESGIDTTQFDKTVRPQDDLFRYVNGGWLATTEIPADRPIYGTFVALQDKVEADLSSLIEELAGNPNKAHGSTAQQVGDLYASFIDTEKLNALGAAPLRPHLAEIDALETTDEMAALVGRLSMVGLPGPVGGFIEADAGDPDTVVLYLFQGGTALPDREYYLSDDARFADARAKYETYLRTVFTLAGRPRAAEDAKAVLALETALAKIQWTPRRSA